MNTPFTPPDGPFGRPFAGPQAFGRPDTPFGFNPTDRRALHEHRRAARREMREHLREHRGGDAGFGFGPFGPGGFGPGFGPGPFGPFGVGGPGGRRHGGRGRASGRSRRGDVRAAILTLLIERPMHGYEMTQEIAARSEGLWKPSPGSIYPTLQLLVDEDLIAPAESHGSKKTFELTDEGRAAAEKIETPPWEEIAQDVDPAAVNLRSALGQLFGAVAQSVHTANSEQQQRILDIVNNARREIYQILGESD
jgi:DNA-binding PadR family transcriptional regulator